MREREENRGKNRDREKKRGVSGVSFSFIKLSVLLDQDLIDPYDLI